MGGPWVGSPLGYPQVLDGTHGLLGLPAAQPGTAGTNGTWPRGLRIGKISDKGAHFEYQHQRIHILSVNKGLWSTKTGCVPVRILVVFAIDRDSLWGIWR